MINLSKIEDIIAIHQVNETLISTGQPTAEQYIRLKDAGVEVVVNVLRINPPTEQPDFSAIQKADLRYYTIHYDNGNPLSVMEDFILLMKSLEGKNILVHCTFNWRASSILDAYFQITKGEINPKAIYPNIDLKEIALEYPAIGDFISAVEKHYNIKIIR